MKCERAEYLIAQDISGDLDEKRKQLLMEHLSGCESCRDAHQTQLAIEAEMNRLSVPEPDGGFALRTTNLLPARTIKTKPTLREILSWIGPTQIVTTVVALMLIIVGISYRGAIGEWFASSFHKAVEFGSSSTSGMIQVGLIVALLLGLLGFGVMKLARES